MTWPWARGATWAKRAEAGGSTARSGGGAWWPFWPVWPGGGARDMGGLPLFRGPISEAAMVMVDGCWKLFQRGHVIDVRGDRQW